MDRERFSQFYQATARSLRAYLIAASGDASLAEDILQDSYLRLLTMASLESLDEESQRRYLFRVATNGLHDHFRKARRTAPLPDIEPVARDCSGDLETRDLVSRSLAQLRFQDRELLWLAYVEQASHREIAAMTGYRESSIRPLLHRAKGLMVIAIRKLLRD